MSKEKILKEIDEIEFVLATIDDEHMTGAMRWEAEERLEELKKMFNHD